MGQGRNVHFQKKHVTNRGLGLLYRVQEGNAKGVLMKSGHDNAPLSEAEMERIIRRIQDGQQEPFRLLVQQFQRRIHVYCHHMLGDRQEAEDAVQDIFIKCYLHIGRFTENVSFSAWLYRIAYNHCINLLKKRSAWYKLFRLYRQHQQQQQPTAYGAPDCSDVVGQLLGPLSSEDRNLILMRVVDGCSFEEISQVIGCKPAAARKKYERLKKRLRPLWSRYMEGIENETE
ncbi:RNA polymerase sigma factor [Paenibacillus sp. GYB003]|uniref:RNA polymerase sigma factor n=1 Tax=Paenibacillus sp. GYB003 TaxID=2994392 RepID=UPI002F9644DB